MKNKILIGVIIVLAALLVFQAAYLSNIKKARQLRGVEARHKPVSVYAFRLDYPSAFERTWDRDPFAEMEMMRQRANRMLGDGFSRAPKDRKSNVSKEGNIFVPGMEIKYTDSAYIVSIDLPGMDKSEINIEVKGKYLMISGERKTEEKEHKGGVYRQELSYGNFFRSILLPEDAIAKEISSEYNNGVLKIKIPKKASQSLKEPSVMKVPVR